MPKGIDLRRKEFRYLKDQGLGYAEVESGHNPAVSERQRKFMGSELARKRAGKRTKTKMSERQLKDYASK